MNQTIQFHLNGVPVELDADPERRLLWAIRYDLETTGCKEGCGQGLCGSCTVLVDGRSTRACITTLDQVRGKKVTTIEGLARNGALHPVQQAFMEHDAMQCGFCTPGMILEAVSLLNRIPRPSREEIIEGMDQNLCRCGAHTRIVDAVEAAARKMGGGKK
jgi:carbon-monoxide dehydrogenase small subunit